MKVEEDKASANTQSLAGRSLRRLIEEPRKLRAQEASEGENLRRASGSVG